MSSGHSIVKADLEARSPWSCNNVRSEVIISPSATAIDGTLTAPGSKSMTNRALLIAALAEGTSRIAGLLRSDDAYWCIESLRRLGIRIDVNDDEATVYGAAGNWPVQESELYVGAAGTVARFLPPLLAAGEGRWKLTGSRRMNERPLKPLLDRLVGQGADIAYEGEAGYLPFTLHGQRLQGGEVTIPGTVSSQFASGLLLAAPYARQQLTLRLEGETVQRDYIAMTLQMMGKFGIAADISADGQSFTVPSGIYQAQSLRLEPDISTCCYFWALAALANGRIRVEGVNPATLQPDLELLNVLEQMGCIVTRGTDWVEVQGTAQLKGGFTVDMQRWSDQTLTLAVLAVYADGPITMRGAAHIRHHECDRLAAIAAELRKLGIEAVEYEDGLTVNPGQPQPALLDPHDDHRMAMALSLLGVKTSGIRVANPGCVSKTCPDYYERLAALGIAVT
ncbi:3-phosphoshikimate 1-carboxyvinyltransferase [Paenibacillaceae bacterium]|nr:3-phosphoshikimate 1-carboxyvinyltransferase [Paenibacillaceae bacterium]